MKIKGAYYQEGGVTEDDYNATPHIKDAEMKKVTFLIRCSVCHYGLCKMMTIVFIERTGHRKENHIFIQPCPICLEAARRGVEPPIIPMSSLGYGLDRLEIEE